MLFRSSPVLHSLITNSIYKCFAGKPSHRSTCQRTYHHEDEHKEIDRDRIEILAELDAIRPGVSKKCVLKYVDNDVVFTEPFKCFWVLRMGSVQC